MLRVSIIVPTRNRSAFLLQALRSAYRQTWGNIEVIVVDEASTDDTLKVLKQYFPRTILVQHSVPKGPSAARNAGVTASSGDYILFLDDDDLLHPGHISALVTVAGSKSSNAAVSGRWRRFECVGVDIALSPVLCYPEGRSAVATLVEFLEPVGEGSICTHSVLWPRVILQRVKWDESLFTNGDVDFLGRVVLSGYSIHGTPVGMAYYRTHSGIRVAGSPSERSLISSMRYRMKWTRLLETHPDREAFNQAMQNGFMSLMIGWSQPAANPKCLPILAEAFRAWGGRRYYLPVPPRNPLKRLAANLVLKIGGPLALGKILNMKRQKSHLMDQTEFQFGSNPADCEDRQVIMSLL